MTVATLTSKGQITIPKDVRDRLHLRAGDRLEFVVADDGTVTVRRREIDLRSVLPMFKASRHVTIEEMNEAIARGWAGQ